MIISHEVEWVQPEKLLTTEEINYEGRLSNFFNFVFPDFYIFEKYWLDTLGINERL